ncbi:hypothetical protein [Clostridium tertium]|uniref:hypothetical protein n=1 Tax=Clostridium tertium TaxID=1559 RepID=UPI0018AB5EBA|nr:hypothetical protein [Clostridium tertium]
MGISLRIILFKAGCFNYIENISLEDSLEIIQEVINDYFEERTYSRYILDNLLLQFNGTSMSYLEYKKELGCSNNDDNNVIDKDRIRNEARGILSDIFG